MSVNMNRPNVVYDVGRLETLTKEKSEAIKNKPVVAILKEPSKVSVMKALKMATRKNYGVPIRTVVIPEDDPIEDLENCTQNIEIKTGLNQVKSFAQLEPIIKNAHVHLSFWGTRYITVKGYKGFLPIDALARRIKELVEINPHFDETERQQGKSIISSINNIYKISDDQVDRSRGLTRFFVNVRRIVTNILAIGSYRYDYSRTRWNWSECELTALDSSYGPDLKGYYRVFSCYTNIQYENAFHIKPNHYRMKLEGLKENYWKAPEKS